MTITAKQIEGTYRNVLLSSTVDHKQLTALTVIKVHRFHTSEYLSFEVTHNDKIIHSSSKIDLAIKAYNKIQTQSNLRQSITDVLEKDNRSSLDSICRTCQRRACNLSNRGTTVKQCVSHQP